MRHILKELLNSGKTLGLGPGERFYVDDQRLQRNLERVVADQDLTAAALSCVITDHRVVETLLQTDASARSIILQLEAKLCRRLGRERAQKLVAAYQRVREARLSSCVRLVHKVEQVHTVQQATHLLAA